MLGGPEDKEAECNARLFFEDDMGDNRTTFRCGSIPGHVGFHRERFKSNEAGTVTVEWEKDARFKCPEHGLLSDSGCDACAWNDLKRWRDLECNVCFGSGRRYYDGQELPCQVCQETGYHPGRHLDLVTAARNRHATAEDDHWAERQAARGLETPLLPAK